VIYVKMNKDYDTFNDKRAQIDNVEAKSDFILFDDRQILNI
jgi:hypothetical protein